MSMRTETGPYAIFAQRVKSYKTGAEKNIRHPESAGPFALGFALAVVTLQFNSYQN